MTRATRKIAYLLFDVPEDSVGRLIIPYVLSCVILSTSATADTRICKSRLLGQIIITVGNSKVDPMLPDELEARVTVLGKTWIGYVGRSNGHEIAGVDNEVPNYFIEFPRDRLHGVFNTYADFPNRPQAQKEPIVCTVKK